MLPTVVEWTEMTKFLNLKLGTLIQLVDKVTENFAAGRLKRKPYTAVGDFFEVGNLI